MVETSVLSTFQSSIRRSICYRKIVYIYSSSSRLRRFAIRPRPVTAVKAPRRTDDLETSVPVFGNCSLDLAVGPASFPTCEVE